MGDINSNLLNFFAVPLATGLPNNVGVYGFLKGTSLIFIHCIKLSPYFVIHQIFTGTDACDANACGLSDLRKCILSYIEGEYTFGIIMLDFVSKMIVLYDNLMEMFTLSFFK